MSSRAWILILSMGIVGLCLFGILTKFAVDSTPDLRRMIEFKSALANELEGRGVEEVSMRKLQGKGYNILLTVGPGAEGERLDLDVARYFVEKFPDRTIFSLEVERVSPPSFGCSAEESRGKRQFSLGQVRADMAEEDRRRRLDEELERSTGFRLVECVRSGGTLRVVAEAPPAYAGDLADAARKIEQVVREVHAGRYSSLEVRACRAPPGTPGAGEVEARFDRTGNEIQPPAAPGRP